MEKVTKHKIRCRFCGKERTYTVVEDDGMDWLGHHRGGFECRTVDDGCSCDLGRIEKQKQKLHKMCLNCQHYKSPCCTNKKMLDKMSGVFQMPEKLVVKKPENKCEFWELNLEIFRNLTDC